MPKTARIVRPFFRVKLVCVRRLLHACSLRIHSIAPICCWHVAAANFSRLWTTRPHSRSGHGFRWLHGAGWALFARQLCFVRVGVQPPCCWSESLLVQRLPQSYVRGLLPVGQP